MNPRSALALAPALLMLGIAAIVLFQDPPPKEQADPATADGSPAAEPPVFESFEEIQTPEVPDLDEYNGIVWSPEQNALRLRLLDVMRQSIWSDDASTRSLLLEARLDELQEILDTLDEEHIDLLVALLLEEPDFMNRRKILDTLGLIGTEAAMDALTDHYWRLYSKNSEAELNYAIKSMGLAHTPASFNRLGEMIQHDLAEPHRFRFVEQLGRHQSNADAVPLFLEVADSKNESYFKTRSRAALALKWANDRTAAPKIERLLEDEEDKYVRQALVGTLGDLGDLGSIRKLESIARTDTNFQTRMSAVRALSRIGGPDARQIVEGISESDADERVRKEAARRLLDMP